MAFSGTVVFKSIKKEWCTGLDLVGLHEHIYNLKFSQTVFWYKHSGQWNINFSFIKKKLTSLSDVANDLHRLSVLIIILKALELQKLQFLFNMAKITLLSLFSFLQCSSYLTKVCKWLSFILHQHCSKLTTSLWVDPHQVTQKEDVVRCVANLLCI